jgi:hypothetical protein
MNSTDELRVAWILWQFLEQLSATLWDRYGEGFESLVRIEKDEPLQEHSKDEPSEDL